VQEFFEGLENTSLALLIRQSLWLYPALEVVHILGIVLLVGAAFMFDLRLLGFSKQLPLSGMASHLLPWSRGGLLLIIPSGILLFMTNAQALGANPTFWIKMGLLLLAALNVFVFHSFIFHTLPQKNQFPFPYSAKISATLSILLWTAIIACGRWLAY
jgi:hypothetical protein